MLTEEKIKVMKKEWLTWNKNIPSRLNHSNIEEFRLLLGEYRQRLEMGLELFKSQMKELIYQAKNKHDPENYNPKIADLYTIWEEEVRIAWWQFWLAINSITNALYDYKPEREKDLNEEVKRLTDLHPDTDWESYFLRRPFPTQDELNQVAMEKLLRELKTDKARAERKWRSFAKKLKQFMEWSESWGVSDKINVETEIKREDTTIRGVPFRFYGNPYRAYKGEEFLNDLHNTTIPLFVKRMKEVMPLMQRVLIPFHVHFQKTETCGRDAAGCYEYSHIDITSWGITGNPKETIKLFAHEMGHHIYKNFVHKEAKEFWSKALKGDLGDVDMEDVIKEWERAGKRDSNLKKTNPILYLQMEGIFFSPYYMNKDILGSHDAIEAYTEGRLERFVRVPKTPITGYAQKNSEEAFCEAIGMLVAYGTRAVHEKVRFLLQAILPNQIKTSKKGSTMRNRIAGKRVDLFNLIKLYNELDGNARKVNVEYIKSLDLQDLNEEIRRVQDFIGEIQHFEPLIKKQERLDDLEKEDLQLNNKALRIQDLEDRLMGRRTRRASDVLSDLENRIARLENSAGDDI